LLVHTHGSTYLIEDRLGAGTIDPDGLQVHEDEVVVGAVGYDLVPELLKGHRRSIDTISSRGSRRMAASKKVSDEDALSPWGMGNGVDPVLACIFLDNALQLATTCFW